MKKNIIQLIPNLIQLETNAKKINSFPFWNSKLANDFFNLDCASQFKFRYIVSKNIEECPEKIQFRFSNLSYANNKWYYSSKKFFLKFRFTIDENTNTMTVNPAYHKHFVRVGCMETAGNIFADYITYKIEAEGKSYQDGVVAMLNGKTYLIFGPGKNFKTTLLNLILENNGYYIGDDFFLLDSNKVYATMPNTSTFDFRGSHKRLLNKDLKKQKVDVSEYEVVLFLVYSDKDCISEITSEEANQHLKFYHNSVNTYYYKFFKNKENLAGQKIMSEKKVLKNMNAKYFLCYFTDINNVLNFIKKS